MPGLVTLRPGDANEVVEAYRYIMQLRHEPAVLALSRQPLPTLDRTRYASAEGVAKGAYVLADAPGGNPEVILIASGSEVCLAVEAHEKLVAERHPVARRLDAVVGHLRAPAEGVPGQRAAARREGPPRDRAGLDVRLGALRRRRGARHRHADVRRVGPAQGAAEEVRVPPRPGRPNGQRAVLGRSSVTASRTSPERSMDAPSRAADPEARFKQEAATTAVRFVQSGMKVGLGTGSTAILATWRIAELLRTGELGDIVGFATSNATFAEAVRLGIPMMSDDMPQDLDVTIDGADEVDPDLNLIKGGGGALLREKIAAQASRRVIIVVDETKPAPRLGTDWPVPVEVMPFAWRSQARFLESLGAAIAIRQDDGGAQFVTDSGNMILDCRFGPIADAPQLAARLSARAGIVEHGLFIDLADDLIVASAHGVQHRTRPWPRR